MKKPNDIPELKQLKGLSSYLEENNLETTNNIVSLKDNLTNLVINVDINKLEDSSSTFIENELKRSGTLTKIETNNNKTAELLEQINFFGNGIIDGIANTITGVFSHGFSSADEEKWKEIENLLGEVYNSTDGIIKQAQDYFLFQIEREQLLRLLNKENISYEEELFVRSILIKGYLNNLRQLISPFYEISDDILIKFKKDRVEYLKQQIEDVNNEKEISLLEQQIIRLEQQFSNEIKNREDSQRRINATAEEITINNTKLNAGSTVLGSVETIRYMTSFAGHKFGWETAKQLSSFGAKAGGFVAKCLPVVSGIVEVGTQANNNRIVFNYEKKLKILSIVDNTKKNLLILEQQVTDYYLDNILTRLQSKLMDNQIKTQEIVIKTYNQQLLLNNQKEVDIRVEDIRDEYYDNVNLVVTRIENSHRVELDKRDEVLNEKDSVINEKNQALNEKDSVIQDKENRLAELDKELFEASVELEQKRKELHREILEKESQITKLNNSISSITDNLSFTKELLEKEKQSLKVQEKALHESLKGNITASAKSALEYETIKRQEFEATLNISLRKQNELTESLENSESKYISMERELSDKIDSLQGLNSKLVYERDSLKKWKQIAIDKEKSLELKIRELSEILSRRERELRELSTEHSVKMSGYQLLEVASQELKNSINIEIEKCNRYRAEILELTKKSQKLGDLEINFTKLDKEYESVKRNLADLAKNRIALNTKITWLESEITERDNKIKDLEGKVWDNQVSNTMGRLAGLISSTSEYLPIPAKWHSHIKTVSQYETGRGLFLSSDLIIFFLLWALCYEFLRFGFKKVMTWLLIKDNLNNLEEIKVLFTENNVKYEPEKKIVSKNTQKVKKVIE